MMTGQPDKRSNESRAHPERWGGGSSDLVDILIALVMVGVIAFVGVYALNGFAEAISFPGPFEDTALYFLDSAASALGLGVGAVGAVVAYLVWFTDDSR